MIVNLGNINSLNSLGINFVRITSEKRLAFFSKISIIIIVKRKTDSHSADKKSDTKSEKTLDFRKIILYNITTVTHNY